MGIRLADHPSRRARRAPYRRLGWRQDVALPADFYPQLPMSVYILDRSEPPATAEKRQAQLDPR